jgi:hypothetical protein
MSNRLPSTALIGYHQTGATGPGSVSTNSAGNAAVPVFA